jgi:hypothetical protein
LGFPEVAWIVNIEVVFRKNIFAGKSLFPAAMAALAAHFGAAHTNFYQKLNIYHLDMRLAD